MRNLTLVASLPWLAACATGVPVGPSAPATPAAEAMPAPAVAGPVVARIGDEAVTAEMLRAEMERRGGRIPGQFATVEQRRILLEQILRERAVLVAARDAGYDKDPLFVATVERLLSARYLDDHLDTELEKIEVTPEELEGFYREHAAEFVVPTRVRGAWILLTVPTKATPEKVAEARERAESVRAEALALSPETRNFGPVALSRSEDAGTRYLGGEFGWVTAAEAEGFRYGPEVVGALLALAAPGEVSPVIRIENGFAIVKLVERQEAAPAPLEKLAPGIRNRLIKEKREVLRDAFYAALLRDLQVTIDEGVLAAIEPIVSPEPDKPNAPPPLPGGP